MILEYAAAHRTKLAWLILENVISLDAASPDGKTNLDTCAGLLRGLDFEVLVFKLDARLFGRPHPTWCVCADIA